MDMRWGKDLIASMLSQSRDCGPEHGSKYIWAPPWAKTKPVPCFNLARWVSGLETRCSMAESFEELIETLGYFGVVLAMLIETLIPPIPSEVIMPLVGLAASKGVITLGGGIAAAVVGSTLGASAWFAAARTLGPSGLQQLALRWRWLRIDPQRVDSATRWFGRHGLWAVFACRIVPGARVLISVPAGLSHMAWPGFLFATVSGYTVWYGFLGLAGFTLAKNFDALHTAVSATPLSEMVLYLAAVLGAAVLVKLACRRLAA
jgi:membrane protein DedA with SNARE-associated domain